MSINAPIVMLGKDPSNPSTYRPTALTLQLSKSMVRMTTGSFFLFFSLESNDLLSEYQSQFDKGREMLDSVLCLESDIRKAQTNKEMVIALFFDVEKPCDMLWREGLLISTGNYE